jgi:4-diphosphocytidyl-2-C-methyl-D-erythritol kinase
LDALILDKRIDKTHPTRVTLNPQAKINLSLVVNPPRPDGFHDLHTIMAKVSLCDDLTISTHSTAGIHLTCSGIASPAGDENIVYQAAELLAAAADITPALEIQLHKRIPSGAGLGGGSSNAAATLCGLNALWQLNYSTEQLANLAMQLGSDVPFFLYGPIAICTGRGEKIEPLQSRSSRTIVLFLTDIHVPTAEIYRHYRCNPKLIQEYMAHVTRSLESDNLDTLLTQPVNTLADTCLQRFKQLDSVKRRIQKIGIQPVCLSGSGSALFTSCDSQQQARDWAGLVNNANLAKAIVVNFEDSRDPRPEV